MDIPNISQADWPHYCTIDIVDQIVPRWHHALNITNNIPLHCFLDFLSVKLLHSYFSISFYNYANNVNY